MVTFIRSFITIAVLLTAVTITSPQAAAQASPEAVEAINELNSLAESGDKQSADDYFLSLSPELQEEVIALSAPVESTLTIKRVDPAPGSAAALAGCWGETRTRVWESILGADVYKITERIGWCYSSGIYGQSCEGKAVGVGYPWSLKRYEEKCNINVRRPWKHINQVRNRGNL